MRKERLSPGPWHPENRWTATLPVAIAVTMRAAYQQRGVRESIFLRPGGRGRSLPPPTPRGSQTPLRGGGSTVGGGGSFWEASSVVFEMLDRESSLGFRGTVVPFFFQQKNAIFKHSPQLPSMPQTLFLVFQCLLIQLQGIAPPVQPPTHFARSFLGFKIFFGALYQKKTDENHRTPPLPPPLPESNYLLI